MPILKRRGDRMGIALALPILRASATTSLLDRTPGSQQFQIWVAAANSVPAARLMVDALRLSTLQNRLRCRVDKARRSVSGARHGGRARRIHQGSRDAAQIWNC